MIETAKLNGLNPEAYLAHAIDQLARGLLVSRLSELLPWNCKDAIAAGPPEKPRRQPSGSAYAYLSHDLDTREPAAKRADNDSRSAASQP